MGRFSRTCCHCQPRERGVRKMESDWESGMERTNPSSWQQDWGMGSRRIERSKRNTAGIEIKNTTPGIDLTPPQKTGFMGRGEIDFRSGILNFYSGVITDCWAMGGLTSQWRNRVSKSISSLNVYEQHWKCYQWVKYRWQSITNDCIFLFRIAFHS